MVILNALRALSAPRAAVRIDRSTDALLHRFSSEHDALRAKLTVLADAAADLARRDQLSPDTESLARLREADDLLESTILPPTSTPKRPSSILFSQNRWGAVKQRRR